MGRLDGKVAVITGATSGIGLHTAELFVAEGAKIVIAGRRAPEGEALASKLGAACIFRQTDVTVEEQMKALIALSVEKFGRIDCLFNNAGGPAQIGGIEGLEVERFDAAMATLVRSVMLGMKHAAPHMRKQGAGSIINNGSIAGRLAGFSSSMVYSAAKAAVIHGERRILLHQRPRPGGRRRHDRRPQLEPATAGLCHAEEGVRSGCGVIRHCEPTGRANARPMTGSAKQSIVPHT
jgi:NAD(P)-dependent dehydrogenase (short-subunit alcohol dehydrogenase family)